MSVAVTAEILTLTLAQICTGPAPGGHVTLGLNLQAPSYSRLCRAEWRRPRLPPLPLSCKPSAMWLRLGHPAERAKVSAHGRGLLPVCPGHLTLHGEAGIRGALWHRPLVASGTFCACRACRCSRGRGWS